MPSSSLRISNNTCFRRISCSWISRHRRLWCIRTLSSRSSESKMILERTQMSLWEREKWDKVISINSKVLTMIRAPLLMIIKLRKFWFHALGIKESRKKCQHPLPWWTESTWPSRSQMSKRLPSPPRPRLRWQPALSPATESKACVHRLRLKVVLCAAQPLHTKRRQHSRPCRSKTLPTRPVWAKDSKSVLRAGSATSTKKVTMVSLPMPDYRSRSSNRCKTIHTCLISLTSSLSAGQTPHPNPKPATQRLKSQIFLSLIIWDIIKTILILITTIIITIHSSRSLPLRQLTRLKYHHNRLDNLIHSRPWQNPARSTVSAH